MKEKKIILTLICLAFSFYVFPQINRANRQYELFRYSKAIPLYKKAVRNKNEKIRKEATAKLADCYRFINDVNEARVWYLKATEFKDTNPLNYFYLGQALRSLRQYEEAGKAFIIFSVISPLDKRGSIYADYCLKIREWINLPPAAEVKNAGPLNTRYSDFGPSFYKNGIVIASDRQFNLLENRTYDWTDFGYLDLYYAEPDFYRDFWSEMSKPSPLSPEFNQTYHDGPACFVNDSQIFLTRTRQEKVKKGETNLHTNFIRIYYGDLGKGKVDYKDFQYNSNNFSNGHPAVSQDQKTMIFVSDMPGGRGGSDLYKSVLTNGKWSVPENLGDVINSIGNEVFPSLVNDTLLYFASDGHMGYGGLDLFVSEYVNGKWSNPVNLKTPVNSSYDDFAIAVCKDLTSGFFSSDRPGGQGSDDIYAFRKAIQPIDQEETIAHENIAELRKISGYVKDNTSNKPLQAASVFVLNTRTNKVKVLETDTNGYFSTPVEKGILYIARAFKQDYLTDCLNFRITPADKESNLKIPRGLLLDKLEVDKIFPVRNIYYDLNKWLIREDAKPWLDKLVGILKQYPVTIELSSYTDCRASKEYNDELSQKRAEAAIRYIMLQGIDPSRLVAKGYGENRLVNHCADGVECSETEHQANRRTEFRILSIDRESAVKQFDPSVFKTGEEVDVYLFDPAFFDKCLGSNEVTQAATAPPNQPESSSKGIPAMVHTDPVSDSSTCYSVQLLASTTEISPDNMELKGTPDVRHYKIGKWYKYVSGCKKTYEEAAGLRETFVGKGFINAFVVRIENGNVAPANQIL